MDLYFVLYLLLILLLIYKTRVFGLINDQNISPKLLTCLFFFKALGVVVFYFVYKSAYGGIEGFDAGKFYGDAKTISEYSKIDLAGYLKLLVGLQDDSTTSSIYKTCLVHTFNWDNGVSHDYFYNDNRIVIRVHSVFHFIAFNSYFVHALFNCFLSFIGIIYLFKSLKGYFAHKKIMLLLVLCFFPSLWFYTGAVLKEGISIFVLGCTVYQLKKMIEGGFQFPGFIYLLVLLFISCLLKPYLLIPCDIAFSLFFTLQHKKVKYKMILFFSWTLVILTLINVLSLVVKNKSLSDITSEHQRVFADAAKGGIFLLDTTKFVRLPYDYNLIKKAPNKDSSFTIKKNTAFIYWEHTHQQDTLFCTANSDTLTVYRLVYDVPKSGSNILVDSYSKNTVLTIAAYFYYTLFFPFFANAHGILQWVASLENLLIALSLFIFLRGVFQNKKEAFPAVFFVSIALGICLLIGATTPNSGAIFRYRSPIIIFIVISAVYYLKPIKSGSHERPD